MVGSQVLQRIWRALGEDEQLLRLVAEVPDANLPSNLPVGALANASVEVASLEAALLGRAVRGVPAGHDDSGVLVTLDPARVATAFTAERQFRLNGEQPSGWAPFSGFWECGSGWVRTHGNYPHHRERLLGALGLPAGSDVEALRSRLAELDRFEVEERAEASDAVAVAVRTAEEWAAHPQAKALRGQPLVAVGRLDATGSVASDPTGGTAAGATGAGEGGREWTTAELGPASAAAPLAGVRVLDLTRVIAGPVATRTLALLGADVLRVDTPALPELEWQHLDTGPGKRSALLDLRQAGDRGVLEQLLATAQVVVTGYRPGSLEEFGLSSGELATRHPGIIIGQVSAWGQEGPWALRRGFDSIVQAASGISWVESADGVRPGVLPAQALDHSAGYLLAAGILSCVRRRRVEAGTWLVSVALARMAHELLSLPRAAQRNGESGATAGEKAPATTAPATMAPTTTTLHAASGELTVALPALSYDGGPTTWPAPSRPWGRDRAEWLSR